MTSILCQVLNGPKVGGPGWGLKMQDQKIQELKMRDQMSGCENAGPENFRVLHFPYFLLVLVLHLLVLHFQSTRPGTWVAYMGEKMDGPHLTALV